MERTNEINNHQNDLILAIVNEGYSEEVMTTMKNVGIRGGTVIQASRIGKEEVVKFLGISLQEEKEIIAIIVTHDLKNKAMKELSHHYGIQTEARGIVLSLPVDQVVGINEI